MKIKKLKYYYVERGWVYLLPRLIIIGYTGLIVGQALLYSIIFGFDLNGFIISVISGLVCAAIVYLSLKMQLIGGLTLLFIGGFIVIGAAIAEKGIDWTGIFIGGVPLMAAGVLFVRESVINRNKMMMFIEKREKDLKP